MNIAFNEVAMAVFKKPLQDCRLNELQQLADQYPYFGPGQLLLAKKLQEENSPSYDEQVQKTSIYFQNRLWLHHLLNENGLPAIIPENRQLIKEKAVTTNEEQNKTDPLLPEAKEPEVIHENPEKRIIEQSEPSIEIAASNIESVAEPIVHENKETEIIPEPVNGETTTQVETRAEILQLKIEPIAPGSALTFEPYHTVDYFASQGIKFKEEEKPKDHFSQQLKSFTEWLKTLKRLPAAETTVTIDASYERKVEQLAEHSLAERHIITEAMAEVWEKQGNKAKAEEIYRKLSLLDPSKSSYFAARIEELKKTS